jgi:hypothetical protein
MFKATITILGLLFAQASLADFLPSDQVGRELPMARSTGGLTQEQFYNQIDKLETLYKPIVAMFRGELVIWGNWTSNMINAQAERDGVRWFVTVFGGLARQQGMTADAFALVICHELGHHLGGWPAAQFSWYSAEGQSDYYSTLACGRILWQDDIAANAMARDAIAPYPKSLCDEAFADETDQNLCYRQMIASKVVAQLLASRQDTVVDFDTPDPIATDVMVFTHPKAQCRLDTLMAGAICQAEWNHEALPRTEASIEPYTCTAAGGFEFGLRPYCWFKP